MQPARQGLGELSAQSETWTTSRNGKALSLGIKRKQSDTADHITQVHQLGESKATIYQGVRQTLLIDLQAGGSSHQREHERMPWGRVLSAVALSQCVQPLPSVVQLARRHLYDAIANVSPAQHTHAIIDQLSSVKLVQVATSFLLCNGTHSA